MRHITEEVGMAAKHVGGFQRLQHSAQGRHRMVRLTAETEPSWTAMSQQDVDGLPA
jgi:hypothetical protein